MAAAGRLRVLDGTHEGTVFVLEREVHTLGRGQASDFRLADPTVSRVQAEFRGTADGVYVTGLSDKNPVWVNGEPAGMGCKLVPGDKVQVGMVHLVFEEIPPESRTMPIVAMGPGLAVTSVHGSADSIPSAPAASATLCPRCGAKELPGARFCGSCGARIPGGAPVQGLPAVAPSAAQRSTPQGRAAQAQHDNSPGAPVPGAPPVHVRTDTMARPPEPFDAPAPSAVSGGGIPLPAAGTVLRGRFELRRHLGHGRVSEVFEAMDRETRKPVAVKILFPYLAQDPEVRDWFFHGANALIVAPHARLLKVHSVHETPDACFSVCELMSGVTLRDQLRSRPSTAGGWNPAEVRKVGTALCEALAKLHAVGAHGEVAPGNVWIDSQGSVTLMDAGLSAPPGKAVKWPPSTDLAAALYDAPEVLRGLPPEPRSDLYSVGAILYQMLTGELPAGLFPPLVRNTAIPGDLAQAVDRAMSPKPENRFGSAEEMARFLSGEVLQGRSRSRRRVAVTVGAVAAVLLLAVGALAVFQNRGPDPALVARVADARQAASRIDEKFKGLGPLADGKVLESAKEAVRRGETAFTESRFEEAATAFGEAVAAVEAEGKAVKEKEDRLARDRAAAEAKAKAGGDALAKAIEEAPAAGAALVTSKNEIMASLESGGGGSIEGVKAQMSGTGRVQEEERRDARGRQLDLARRIEERWKKFLADGEPLRRAREDRDRARSLLEGGDPAAVDSLCREAIGRLEAGLCDELGTLLRDLCAEAGVPEPEESGRVRAAKVASGYGPLFAPALEAARAKFEKSEQAKRCGDCAAEGACVACKGTGGARSDCAKCAGKGAFDVDCRKCAGKKDLACARCAGKALVDETCAGCKGAKTVACAKCGGTTPKCEPCQGAGRRNCLRCRGTGTIHAGGEKGKSCPDCGATGKRECTACKGGGTVVCATCQGKPEIACPDCKGAGTKPVPCTDCKAMGRVPCGDCAATGRAKDDCADCEEGKVLAACPACKGKGKCPACGGRGRRE